ncbi:hypothetical protein Hypma_003215 [Hypsizygus marmoreus]|uniref:RRM Nup35-type domain-containing protein n=1 Tax=Hypsizygus marmoreus TaxID=39966 RepID=A0A369JZ83_HYPMA|nr:hypothetical protein Hypma_003215 [Hypsizygus marmoreus]
MHSSPFTVAGMSTSTGTQYHPPNLNAWGSTSTGGPLTTSFSDTLSQSRSHYQPGYLMSSQTNNAPQGSQRVDEVPVVPTKAKMNQILSRGSSSDFGMDSMFESSRQRQKLTDEDAPPINSVFDIPNEFSSDSISPGRFQPRNSTMEGSPFPRRQQRVAVPTTPQQPAQPLYIIVFGYPPEKYSLTVEYFQSLGAATDPDPNVEIVNCFRIGFYDPGDALRAVRKNGEVLGGAWMIGTKWADPAQAESILGQSLLPTSLSGLQLPESASQSNAMAVDEPTTPQSQYPSPHPTTPSIGTPIKLAPSTSAFRRGKQENVSTPQPQRGWGPRLPGAPAAAVGATPGTATTGQQGAVPPGTSSPNKGVIGQVSDLIFGW